MTPLPRICPFCREAFNPEIILPASWVMFCGKECEDAAHVRIALGQPSCVVCGVECPKPNSGDPYDRDLPAVCSYACGAEWVATKCQACGAPNEDGGKCGEPCL